MSRLLLYPTKVPMLLVCSLLGLNLLLGRMRSFVQVQSLAMDSCGHSCATKPAMLILGQRFS